MRPILTVALVFAMASGIRADEIYVPSNTPGTGSCNHIQFNPNWSTASGVYRYQLVAPSSLLGGKACLITDVAFAPCSSVVFKATMFEMSMSHTTLMPPSTTFATNIPNPQIVIPAGAITFTRTANQWSPIKLTRPFTYNGIDHLTVELRYQGGTLVGATSTTDRQESNLTLNYWRIIAWGAGAYNATTAAASDARGLKMRLTCAVVSLNGSGSPRPGGTVNLDLTAPADSMLPFQLGTSLGTGPIPIDQRKLGLSPDGLLVASVSGSLPTVFSGYSGFLDAAGKGTAKLILPGLSVLIGLRLHTAFLTLSGSAPSGVKSISNTFSFTITT